MKPRGAFFALSIDLCYYQSIKHNKQDKIIGIKRNLLLLWERRCLVRVQIHAVIGHQMLKTVAVMLVIMIGKAAG